MSSNCMQSNIQGLLDKIYQEGIEKTRSEADEILAQARAEASRIREAARDEANRTLDKATKEAKLLKESTEADLRTAMRQALVSLKAEITDLISHKTLDGDVREVSTQTEFLGKLVQTVTQAWISQGVSPDQIELIIPADMRTEWESILRSKIQSQLDGLVLKPAGIPSGFQIQRKDKGFRLDFTEDALKEFFKKFLRQKTAEWLF